MRFFAKTVILFLLCGFSAISCASDDRADDRANEATSVNEITFADNDNTEDQIAEIEQRLFNLAMLSSEKPTRKYYYQLAEFQKYLEDFIPLYRNENRRSIDPRLMQCYESVVKTRAEVYKNMGYKDKMLVKVRENRVMIAIFASAAAVTLAGLGFVGWKKSVFGALKKKFHKEKKYESDISDMSLSSESLHKSSQYPHIRRNLSEPNLAMDKLFQYSPRKRSESARKMNQDEFSRYIGAVKYWFNDIRRD